MSEQGQAFFYKSWCALLLLLEIPFWGEVMMLSNSFDKGRSGIRERGCTKPASLHTTRICNNRKGDIPNDWLPVESHFRVPKNCYN